MLLRLVIFLAFLLFSVSCQTVGKPQEGLFPSCEDVMRNILKTTQDEGYGLVSAKGALGQTMLVFSRTVAGESTKFQLYMFLNAKEINPAEEKALLDSGEMTLVENCVSTYFRYQTKVFKNVGTLKEDKI